MMQHAILVTRARNAAGNGFPQDAHDADHPVDHLTLREVAARHLILDRELPERRVFLAIMLKHVCATREWHAEVLPRGNGKDGMQSLGDKCPRNLDKSMGADLDELLEAQIVSDDLMR